jgi:hypothetical protein
VLARPDRCAAGFASASLRRIRKRQSVQHLLRSLHVWHQVSFAPQAGTAAVFQGMVSGAHRPPVTVTKRLIYGAGPPRSSSASTCGSGSGRVGAREPKSGSARPGWAAAGPVVFPEPGAPVVTDVLLARFGFWWFIVAISAADWLFWVASVSRNRTRAWTTSGVNCTLIHGHDFGVPGDPAGGPWHSLSLLRKRGTP